MDASSFDPFRSELRTLYDSVHGLQRKSLRDEDLRERFRTLFRVWISSVEPSLRNYLLSKRDLVKLTAELEKLAQLASKYKPVSDYRKRLRRAIQLADGLVIHLPPSEARKRTDMGARHELFIPTIPDLPLQLVPNPILGWRSRLEAFLNKYPFDKSVFIMIRYRKRNDSVIRSVKASLIKQGLFGVLASEHNLTDDLYNPVACLLCCSRGIAIFDGAERRELFNPNVAYELGMLHLLGRPCLILKHTSLQTLQTDILMKLYKAYSSPEEAARLTVEWSQTE